MNIKNVEISNYRQLHKVKLEFQNNLTVLAGPNNSGKTTLSMLLKSIFNDNKFIYTNSDIPTCLSVKWIEKMYPFFEDIILPETKEKGIKKIFESIVKDDSIIEEYIIPQCEIKIQVDYDKKTDDIRNFADYIMDLDDKKNSFYFLYTFELSISKFEKNLFEKYDKLKSKYENINQENCKEKEVKIYALKEMLLQIYCDSLVDKCYFCNSNYKNSSLLEIPDFKKLFNFSNIQATRRLDDIDTDSSKTLSKKIVSLLKGNEEWLRVTQSLPETILKQIIDADAKTAIQKTSVNSLDKTIQNISKTSGGHVGKIMLEMDISEEDVDEFIKRITRAKYDIDGFLLNESSQGLGFSNLIFLHMQLEEYLKTIDPFKVNIFFIEEPESHMHPQMQNVFIRYLTAFYQENNLQGLITTHSNEIAKLVGLSNLRVIRQTSKLKSELFDLSKFKESIKDKQEDLDDETKCLLENFFDWFFEIGYSEVIFADKVVLYEGDTERLFIRKLLTLEEFKPLRDSYIAFIQVGGDYAYNYKFLIECLKIKALVITDLDYDKEVKDIDAVLSSKSTNSTINKFYKDESNEKDKNPTVKELYEWKKSNKNIAIDGLIYIAYQDQEGLPRTLEESMLAKLLSIDTFVKNKRSDWEKIRKANKLRFSIPNNNPKEDDSEFTIREIINSTSNSKTDFMYSVILNSFTDKMLPKYIKDGLVWLME